MVVIDDFGQGFVEAFCKARLSEVTLCVLVRCASLRRDLGEVAGSKQDWARCMSSNAKRHSFNIFDMRESGDVVDGLPF